jgi:CHAT domain-containing protein
LTGRENINSILIVGSTDDPTLPKVGEEFENISRAVKSSKRVSSKAEVQQAVSEVAALHFGSHAYFDREHPVSSGLSLKDGLLTLGEITGLRRFRPRVVTMGACESGEANVSMGDEVWSLQTAFMFSGASAVIGSLWQQDGDAAQIFYSTFYREVVPGGDVGAAFYNAMQEARHRRQSAVGEGIPRLMNSDNPCFWAGFNLIGQ